MGHDLIHRPIIDPAEPYERVVIWLGREWLERRVDRDRLDLRGEEDLMDIFRILIYISATAMTQAIFEEDSGPARARLCAQLDILRRGTAAPSATKT